MNQQLPSITFGTNNTRELARTISLVENEAAGYEDFMQSIPPSSVPVIGITGPPGAGKSTLVDALIEKLVAGGKRIGVLCVDPTSPFNYGALLGDRIRMSQWYTHPNVFIRSLASRGSLGGLHPKILEITDVMKVAAFDYVILETVGVGQTEVEIAGLADVTLVVLVPEAGDEVQTMKAGLMEIADVFVVNKADRPNTEDMVRGLRAMLAPAFANHTTEVPIIKAIASQKKGVEEIIEAIERALQLEVTKAKKLWLYAERSYILIQQRRMKDVSKARLMEKLQQEYAGGEVNLYRFVSGF